MDRTANGVSQTLQRGGSATNIPTRVGPAAMIAHPTVIAAAVMVLMHAITKSMSLL